MAVTGPETHKSKKSKHKKPSKDKPDKNVISGSAPEEQDASKTDLNKPVFQLPHRSDKFQASGDVSDSETDIDKPPKNTAVPKSVGRTQNSKSYYNNTQSNVQRADEDEVSDNEQQSMSLLQLHPAKPFNQSSANISSKSDHSSLLPKGTLKSKVIRKPNVPEMSESESDSYEETNHHHHPQSQQPQSQPDSESEEESDEENAPPETSQIIHGTRSVPQPASESESEEENEQQQIGLGEESRNHHHRRQQQIVTDLNPEKIKKEVISNESSSFEEDDPSPLQEFQNVPLATLKESRNVTSQSMSVSQNSTGGVINKIHSTDIATFEQEHTRVSAPVIDIPEDSRVWVLQVPRGIEAVHLHGQHLPKKLKGGEVLNLPSGRWQILEQPYEASRSTLNCIVSTGSFCYEMRWLQPRGFWFLKHMRSPLQTETDDEPWSQEITPLPIKELLKMKTNAAISKDQHLKPSKKRHRNSDLDLPSKRTKMEPEVPSPKKNESRHKKSEYHHVPGGEEEPSTVEEETEKGKKRKRTSEVNEASPSKKKKKSYLSEVDDQSHLEHSRSLSQSTSVADVNRSTSSAAAENISFSKKEKKKSKHKEICDESLKRISSPVKITHVKQEITTNDSEEMEHASSHNLSGSSGDKKQRKHKSRVKQEVGDQYLEIKQNGSQESAVKEKKKKGKHRSRESEHGETFQPHEKKIELSSIAKSVAQGTEKPIKKEKDSEQMETSFENTVTELRKKKKHKHHPKREEGEVSFQETKEDIPVKKKKKHKHKESDVPKVKQENFWDRETSPDYLSHLYLTQVTPEDR